jgi:putative Mg2+ transporter-C (MgtC) family protein
VFELDEREMVFRLVAALALGAIVGIDREVRNRPAGLRTHALASLGAALFTMASIEMAVEARNSGHGPVDASRIVSTVVQGIGFLAAGVIFAHKAKIRGLTTAAGLWVTAALGVLCGMGMYFLAVAATIATAVVLAGIKTIENRFLEPTASGEEQD